VGAPKGRKTLWEVVLRQPNGIANWEAAEKEWDEEILTGERKAMSGVKVKR
jgi:hypothetical protein